MPELWIALNKIDKSEITPIEKFELYHTVFISWLLNDRGLNKIAAAKTLMAITLIEFFGFDGKKTSEDWDSAEIRQREFLSMLQNEGRHDLAESGAKMFEDTSSRAVVWLIVYSEWRNLCSNELSEQHIKEWLENNPDSYQQ